MGRIKRGGYIIEFQLADHPPPHIHVYRDRKPVAKVEIPSLRLLQGRLDKKLLKVLKELQNEGKI